MSYYWLQRLLFTLLALLVKALTNPPTVFYWKENVLLDGEKGRAREMRGGKRISGNITLFIPPWSYLYWMKKKERLRFFWAGKEICLYMFVSFSPSLSLCAHSGRTEGSFSSSNKSGKMTFICVCESNIMNTRAHDTFVCPISRPIYIQPQSRNLSLCDFHTSSSCT